MPRAFCSWRFGNNLLAMQLKDEGVKASQFFPRHSSYLESELSTKGVLEKLIANRIFCSSETVYCCMHSQ